MIITLSGENDFGRDQALAALVDGFVAENGDLALERIDGEEAEFARISEALTSLPFLANRKLIVFKNPSVNKEFADKFENLLKNIPETTDLVLVEARLDKRTNLYKFLKQDTDFREFNPLDADALSKWLKEEVGDGGGEISAGDSRYLVERVGENQQMLAGELAKLLAYDSKITRENIEKLVPASAQSQVFDLLDAAFSGNKKRALKIYAEQRQLGEAPQKIIGLLAWQLHLLALAKTADGKSQFDIARAAKVSPYSVRNAQRLCARLDLEQIRRYVSDLLALDAQLKSAKLDADEALKTYFLGL